MAALDFPTSPTLGQIFTGANKSWTWDGSKWIISQYDNGLNEAASDAIEEARKKAIAVSFVLVG